MITPITIELERSTSLAITFDDGRAIDVPVASLRAACPCADCRGVRERDGRPGGDSPVAVDAELHGSYGLSIAWDDGHSTGIYSWEYLLMLGGET
jgi:DUF971 family protein